jgi:hypothetical protein
MTPKNFLFLLAMVVATVAQAKIPEYVPQFKIISDTLDEDVPAGTCLVTGVITHHEKTVNEATIKSYTYDKQTGVSEMTQLINSKKLGKIRMNLDTNTYFLTAWKPGTGTAYVEGVKFKSQHHIIIEIYLPEEEDMIMVEKPVVYLYNDRATKEVNVQVTTDNDMVFTYPKMQEGNQWNVQVGQDGIKTNDGRSYPYLFWEAAGKGDFYTRQEGKIAGSIVKTDTVVSFLEAKLYALHLNPTEVTDFISYWGPRLQQQAYAIVQFKVDESVNEIAALDITPQPDWMRRVYMVFTGFETYPSVAVTEEPILEEGLVKREGFYVVEWGGSEIPMIKL